MSTEQIAKISNEGSDCDSFTVAFINFFSYIDSKYIDDFKKKAKLLFCDGSIDLEIYQYIIGVLSDV